MDYAAMQARIDVDRETRRITALARNAQKRADRVAFVRQAKDVPCADCGNRYPYYVMDFDNRDRNEKEFGLAGAIARGVGMERLAAEIAKCDVVCANCHRIRTHQRVPPWGRRDHSRGPFCPN